MTPPRAALALFLYARPEHARKVIDALRTNPLAAESDLFAFCDGAKGDADRAAVQATRALAAGISGFKSVTMAMAETNRGIARSIREGVSRVLQDHDRCVVIEDDVVLSPHALAYFNAMLDHFAATPAVASISGFAYARHVVPLPPRLAHDVYFTPRLNCWGWATWRDRWQAMNWDPANGDRVLTPTEVAALRRGGSDLPGLWRLHREGRIDSWAVPWTCDQIRRGLVTVHPRQSYVRTIGLDGSGAHGAVHDDTLNQASLSMATTWNIPSAVRFSRRILWAHKDFYDRLLPTGRLRRWLSIPAWWVRLARLRASRSHRITISA